MDDDHNTTENIVSEELLFSSQRFKPQKPEQALMLTCQKCGCDITSGYRIEVLVINPEYQFQRETVVLCGDCYYPYHDIITNVWNGMFNELQYEGEL